jgi:hypothetical protein
MTPTGGPFQSSFERQSERRKRGVQPSRESYFGGRAARLLPDAGNDRARPNNPEPRRAGAEGGPRRLTHAALQPERRHPERPEDSRPFNLRDCGAPPCGPSGQGESPRPATRDASQASGEARPAGVKKSVRGCQPRGRHPLTSSVTVLTPATVGQKGSTTARSAA